MIKEKRKEIINFLLRESTEITVITIILISIVLRTGKIIIMLFGGRLHRTIMDNYGNYGYFCSNMDNYGNYGYFCSDMDNYGNYGNFCSNMDNYGNYENFC